MPSSSHTRLYKYICFLAGTTACFAAESGGKNKEQPGSPPVSLMSSVNPSGMDGKDIRPAEKEATQSQLVQENWTIRGYKTGKDLFMEEVKDKEVRGKNLFNSDLEVLTFYRTMKRFCQLYVEAYSKDDKDNKGGRGYEFSCFDILKIRDKVKSKTSADYGLTILPYEEDRGNEQPFGRREVLKSREGWFHNPGKDSLTKEVREGGESTLKEEQKITHEKALEAGLTTKANDPAKSVGIGGSLKVTSKKTVEDEGLRQEVSSFSLQESITLPPHSSVKIERSVYRQSYLVPYFDSKRVTGKVGILMLKNVRFGARPEEVKVVSLSDILNGQTHFSVSGQSTGEYEPIQFDGEALILKKKAERVSPIAKVLASENMQIYDYFGDRLQGKNEDQYITTHSLKPRKEKQESLLTKKTKKSN